MIIEVVVKTLDCNCFTFLSHSIPPTHSHTHTHTHTHTAGGLQGVTAGATAMGGQGLGGLTQTGLGGLGNKPQQQQLGIGTHLDNKIKYVICLGLVLMFLLCGFEPE